MKNCIHTTRTDRPTVPDLIGQHGWHLYRQARAAQGPADRFNGCCLRAAHLAAAMLLAYGYDAQVFGPSAVAVDSPRLVALHAKFRNCDLGDPAHARRIKREQLLTGAFGLLTEHHFAVSAGQYLVDVAAPDWTRRRHQIEFPPLCLPWREPPEYDVAGCGLTYMPQWHLAELRRASLAQ